jgi:hypothetical protein
MLLSVLLTLLFQGAVTYGVFQVIMEGRASVGESISRALSRVGTLLLMGIAVFFCFGGLFVLGSVFSVLEVVSLGYFLSYNAVPQFAVFVFFLIALFTAIILFITLPCSWYVASPACVVERTGAFVSLGRSARLTKGHRLKIFGMLTLVLAAIAIISKIVDSVTAGAFGGGFVVTLISVLTNVVPVTFVNVMSAVTYYSLRVAKENLAATSLAEIFD